MIVMGVLMTEKVMSLARRMLGGSRASDARDFPPPAAAIAIKAGTVGLFHGLFHESIPAKLKPAMAGQNPKAAVSIRVERGFVPALSVRDEDLARLCLMSALSRKGPHLGHVPLRIAHLMDARPVVDEVGEPERLEAVADGLLR